MLAAAVETYGGSDSESYLRDSLAQYPQGPHARFIRPDETAHLVFFLASDAAVWTLYYRPDSTTRLVWAQTNFVGFKILGTNSICGLRSLSLERWQTLLVHGTNHARNPDSTTPLESYQSEFRAYWVAEYRTVTDLDERARQVKAHVLASYPPIRAAYDSDETVRRRNRCLTVTRRARISALRRR